MERIFGGGRVSGVDRGAWYIPMLIMAAGFVIMLVGATQAKMFALAVGYIAFFGASAYLGGLLWSTLYDKPGRRGQRLYERM